MRRLNFDDEPSASQEERARRREAIDKLIENNVEDEGEREKFRIKLDALVLGCLPTPEGGVSVEGGIEQASDSSIDAIVHRVIDPAYSPLNKQFDAAPNPSAYVR